MAVSPALRYSEPRGNNWSKSECLLALWAYHILCEHPQVKRTLLFRAIGHAIQRTGDAFARKVQNVSACDPRPRDQKPIAALDHIQRLLLTLYDEYWPRRAELDTIAERLLTQLSSAQPSAEQGDSPTDTWALVRRIVFSAAEKECVDACSALLDDGEEATPTAVRALRQYSPSRELAIGTLVQLLQKVRSRGTERAGRPQRQRVGQELLHELLVIAYNGCCALCETWEESQLITSHIVSWAEDVAIRLDPENAILLCRLHDGLFDSGLVGFSDDLDIVVANHWKPADSPPLARAIQGATFRRPTQYAPNPEYLGRHRAKHNLDTEQQDIASEDTSTVGMHATTRV